ncbi:hypothetical protein CAP36_00670 [Chitinophagaceae bacterium IBVUCB2]|nr:hypothetical protein CAP36_00670 [Chitinophagaceae bacterium IBVUCB2]
MKIIFLLISISFYCLPVFSQKPDTIGAGALFTKMMGQINPKHANWVRTTAATVNQKRQTETEVKAQATNWAVLGSLNNADIEALCFLVLMQASKSAQEDLKSIMDGVKTINENKKKMRETMTDLNNNASKMNRQKLDSAKLLFQLLPQTLKRTNTTLTKPKKSGIVDSDAAKWSTVHTKEVTKQELDNTIDKIKNDLDSMNEMGEMESLRLQMAMDRMSKMMSTLSNLLKKISDTQNGIIQNLK